MQDSPYSFFGCHVLKGKKHALPVRPGRVLHLKQAAVSGPATGTTRLLIRTAAHQTPLVLCSMRPGCEQSTITALLEERDAATLEVTGAGAVHVCGTWLERDLLQSADSYEMDSEEGEEESGEEGEEGGDDFFSARLASQASDGSAEEESEEESEEEVAPPPRKKGPAATLKMRKEGPPTSRSKGSSSRGAAAAGARQEGKSGGGAGGSKGRSGKAGRSSRR